MYEESALKHSRGLALYRSHSKRRRHDVPNNVGVQLERTRKALLQVSSCARPSKLLVARASLSDKVANFQQPHSQELQKTLEGYNDFTARAAVSAWMKQSLIDGLGIVSCCILLD